MSSRMSSRTGASARRLVVVNWRDRTHPEAGGAEVVCEELAHRLAASGWEVTYLTSRGPGQARTDLRGAVRYVRLGGRLGVYPLVLGWLFLRRRRIDAVLDSQNGIPFFSPLAVRRSAAVVLLLHHVHQDQFAMHFPPAAARMGRVLEGPVSRIVYRDRTVVAVSASTRQQARQLLQLHGPILVAPPGSHPVQVPPVRAPSPRIVCVGRLVAHKRLELVIRCLPELLRRWPDLELHIVGDGAARPGLEAETLRLGLGSSVTFHGMVDEDTKVRLVATGWVGATASAFEGWCLSVIEANAAGLPMVGLHRPGVRDSIRDGETGWLARSEEELAATLSRAIETLSDPDTAASFSEAVRSWASRFTWGEMATRVEACLVFEHTRRSLGRTDRRHVGDVSTVVHVAAQLSGGLLRDRLRPLDRIREHTDGSVTVLLVGADTEGARTALDRVLPGWHDSQVRISVAQQADLVDLTSPAEPLAPFGPVGPPRSALSPA